MYISPINLKECKKEIKGRSNIKTHPNFRKIQNTLSTHALYLAQFENEETIVTIGRILTDISFSYKNLTYAEVPLGIILRGKVIVFENGKAIRHLTTGDFIGLFETAHYLQFNTKKRLGNWTLLAEGDTRIIFFGKDGFNHARIALRTSLESHLIKLSKKDRTPKPLTELPLLDRFVHLRNLPLQEDVLIIAHTHILESSYPLFRHLASVVGYQNIFLMDKPYSTIPNVADKVIEMGIDITRVVLKSGLAYEFSVQESVHILWGKILGYMKKVAISKIIIIDDGADVLTNIPWKYLGSTQVVGVEQTTRGIMRLTESFNLLPPIINVAGCALKKEIESCFIADGIIQEVKSLIKKTGKSKIGIVGTGNIGKKIISGLKESQALVDSYDFSNFTLIPLSSHRRITSLSELIKENDIIIGATGRDFLRGVVLDKAKGEKYLVSASSADVEFYSILNRAGFPAMSFKTIIFKPHKTLTFNILNAGYPINFNRAKEIEKSTEMQLTRTLLFAGFVQSLKIPKKTKGYSLFKLDIDFQREILNAFVAFNTGARDLTLSTRKIDKLSDGETNQFQKNRGIYKLHETTSPYLNIVRKHTRPYTKRIFGKEIIIFPKVMSPQYDWSGIFGVETLPDVKNKTVLEIGCGSGIISLFAAIRGAKSVDAVDINNHAIDNTNENFKKHNIINAKAFYSNLFSKVKDKYDLIIFNLPYHNDKPKDILEHGVTDEGYKIMKKFIASLPNYMNNDGIADIGFSVSGDTTLLLNQFKKSKLEILEKYSDERFGYNCDVYLLKKR